MITSDVVKTLILNGAKLVPSLVKLTITILKQNTDVSM